MAKWLAKEFDWDTGRYTGRYYDIAEAGIVAVFVDSFYGDDASADPEDPDLPLKTLGAAITYLNTNGADGSRIFMNGIFSETLPAQTYWYQFIGCGGGRNGYTVFTMNQATTARPTISKAYTIWENVLTLGYSFQGIRASINPIYFLNCQISFCLIILHNSENSTIFINSKVISCKIDRYNSATYGTFFKGINSVFYNIEMINNMDYRRMYGYNNYFKTDPASVGSLSNSASTSLIDVEAQFINAEQNDFNVRLTSPLLGTGAVDEITGNPTNIGGVDFGLPYNGLIHEFSESGGATITDLTVDATGKYTITAPATSGTLETALMDLGNIYPLENIDLFNVFDFLGGEITQGVFEDFVSPRMALTIKLKYGLTSAEVDDCPWLLIEYGKQPTFSGTGASRVGNADDTFGPDTFQTITCRYMKLFITLQNNS